MVPRLPAVLPALLATTAGLFVATSALTAQPPAAKPAPASAEAKSPGDLRTSQEQTAQLFLKFKTELLRLAQKLQRSDRPEDQDRAKVIMAALDLAAKENVDNQFQKLIAGMSKGTGNVTDVQGMIGQDQQLTKALQEILTILMTDDESARLKAEIAKLEEYLKAAKDIKRAQEIARSLTEASKMDPNRLAKQQADLAERTKDLADKMGGNKKGSEKDGANPGGGKGEKETPRADPKSEAKDGDKAGEGKSDTNESKADAKEPTEPKGGDPKASDSGAEPKSGGKDGDKPDAGSQKPGDSAAEGNEPKAGDPKSGDPKSGEPKAGDSKSGTPKSGEPKSGDPKAGDPKSGDPKAGDPKAGDPKSGEPKAGDPKSGDPKSGDPKGGDSKPSGGDPKGGGQPGGSPKGGNPPKVDGPSGDAKSGDNAQADSKARGAGKADTKAAQGQPGGDAKNKNAGQQVAGGPKGGGSPPPSGGGSPPPGGGQPPPSAQQPQTPGRKQVAEAYPHQKAAEDDLKKEQRPQAGKGQDKAIDELAKAIQELEKRLKQLREEEMLKLLANLEARCNRMLAMQIEVYEATKAIQLNVLKNLFIKSTADYQKSQQQAEKEGEIVAESDRALKLLESEGSAVAFATVLQEVRVDMVAVQRRLEEARVGNDTQAIEENIIAMLKDMVQALKKAQQEIQQNQQQPPPPGQQKPGNQKLIDLLAELKLIRSLQVQVNNRTKMYGDQEKAEQAKDPLVQKEVRDLSARQEKLQEMIDKIASGENR